MTNVAALLQSQGYLIKDGVLIWKGRIMLLGEKDIINQVLLESHSFKVGGHVRVAKIMVDYTSKIIVEASVNNIVKLYGILRPIVSDKDHFS